MYRYAQTNIQLYEQLIDAGFSDSDLICVRDGYDLAARLFSAQFRPNGKPFIAHLVGTASVLVEHGASLPVVLAGLFHAAYAQGDFGGFWPRVTRGKRQRLSRVIGEQAEVVVAQYAAFQWNSQRAASLAESLPQLSERERWVLLMRLANELEEAADHDMLYDHEARRQSRIGGLRSCIEIARKLDMPDLAKEIGETYAYLQSRKVPAELVSGRTSDHTSPPLSHRRRLIPAISHALRAVWSQFPEDFRIRFRSWATNRVLGIK